MIEMTEEEFKWWLDNRFKAGYDAGFAIAQEEAYIEPPLDDGVEIGYEEALSK
jgi:hypothetical protein